MSTLKNIFYNLGNTFSNDAGLISRLWTEIESCYSMRKRYYHSLSHLENMFEQLTQVESRIQNWNAVLFALFYHDLVYNAMRSDNEEKSITLAKSRMVPLGVSLQIIEITSALIMATKTHTINTDSDINFFIDTDLSILGQPWPVYETYFKNVRKEYAIYPNLVYKPGRRKVLKHFLSMEKIFKSEYFHMKLEWQAKQNLQQELDLLS